MFLSIRNSDESTSLDFTNVPSSSSCPQGCGLITTGKLARAKKAREEAEKAAKAERLEGRRKVFSRCKFGEDLG